MTRPTLRTFATLLLLLAYLGQSLAVVGAPCAPPELPVDSHMSGMDHSMHQMDDGEDSCCDDGGFCSMNHCLAVAAVPVTSPGVDFPPAASAPLVLSAAQPACRYESLFRPPISL